MPPAGQQGSGPPGFADIVEQHESLLRCKARNLAGNLDVDNDLVQETWKRALDGFERLKHANPAAWLVTILTNLYFDHLDHLRVIAKAEPELLSRAGQDDAADTDSPPYSIADADLAAAVQSLDRELREVVELCCLQGLRHREAAVRLGIPIGTVGTRMKRARERLRALLEAPRPSKLRVVKP
jgi:RNA polymerase sigma-70 factor (ECF subfamily)